VATTRHARRSDDGDRDERREARAAEPAPQEVTLRMQRAHGNQAVARVLARRRTLARIGGDPTFTFGGQQAEQETITADDCEDSVEEIVEDRYGGLRNLFMRNEVATSVSQWADLIFSFFEENYTLDGVDRGTVLQAIKAVKDKHREETLLHMARTHVYWSLGEDVAPWDLTELKKRLRKAGVYFEAEDDEVLEAIFDTEGKFARTKVEFDTAANIELLDEDNVVVLIDHHQQKHQRDKIAHFPAYSGEPGSKFATGKGLEWHRTNTAQVVKATVLDSVDKQRVTTSTTYAPPKVAKDGIVYDLIVSHDAPTGKWVGSYHCNPLRDED
jgi:hypothetical protein